MATPSSFSRRPSCGACPGRPRTPTSGVRASGQGDGVTQRPPDGVVAEKLECTLVCILTRSLVTVAAAEQGELLMVSRPVYYHVYTSEPLMHNSEP